MVLMLIITGIIGAFSVYAWLLAYDMYRTSPDQTLARVFLSVQSIIVLMMSTSFVRQYLHFFTS